MRQLISRLVGGGTDGQATPSVTQPAEIHLERDRQVEWLRRDQVTAQVRQLRAAGFETITTFRIREMPDLKLVGLAHPAEGFLAVVYEHKLAGVWCNLVAIYRSGGSLTVSNAVRGRKLKPLSGHDKHLLRGASIPRLYRALARHVRSEPLLRITPGNFVEVFEQAYARELAARRGLGGDAPGASRAPGAAPAAAAPAGVFAQPGAVGEPSAQPEPRPAGPRPGGAAQPPGSWNPLARDPQVDRRCAPLFAALAARDQDAVREFLSRGMELWRDPVEGRDGYGRTVLMAAIATGQASLVEAFVKSGANVNALAPGLPGDAVSAAGSVFAGLSAEVTPLTVAIETGEPRIVETLIAAGADLGGVGGLTPLQFAAQQGDVEMVQALLAGGAEVDGRSEGDYSPLLIASSEGYVDVAGALLAAGADVELRCEGETAISLAAVAGAREVVELLAPRVKPRAARQAERILAEAGPAPDPQAKRLMLAAMNGKAPMVAKLLAAGVPADAVEAQELGEKPVTPLMVAAQGGHLEVMKLLIAGGADLNYSDGVDTPLRRALNPIFMDAARQPEVIRLLVESGAFTFDLSDDERVRLAAAVGKGT